jgi:hypothetical protein
VLLLFYAYGLTDLDAICARICKTARWADAATVKRLMYATSQRPARGLRATGGAPIAHRRGAHARGGLGGADQVHDAPAGQRGVPRPHDHRLRGAGQRGARRGHRCHRGPPVPRAADARRAGGPRAGNANVLPHLTGVERKVEYLAYLIGVLLSRPRRAPAGVRRAATFFTRRRAPASSSTRIGHAPPTMAKRHHVPLHGCGACCHLGNKRVDVCGVLLSQQIRNALFFWVLSYASNRTSTRTPSLTKCRRGLEPPAFVRNAKLACMLEHPKLYRMRGFVERGLPSFCVPTREPK